MKVQIYAIINSDYELKMLPEMEVKNLKEIETQVKLHFSRSERRRYQICYDNLEPGGHSCIPIDC